MRYEIGKISVFVRLNMFADYPTSKNEGIVWVDIGAAIRVGKVEKKTHTQIDRVGIFAFPILAFKRTFSFHSRNVFFSSCASFVPLMSTGDISSGALFCPAG